MTTWFADIARGESTEPGRVRALAADEDGMFSFASLVGVLFLAILIAFALNIGRTTSQRLEVQNAADACAVSLAAQGARGMNAITATNHLMGQFTALVVLHDAIGGIKCEKKEAEGKASFMSTAARTATFGTLVAPLDYLVETPGEVYGATLYDWKLSLQYWLIWAGIGDKIGKALQATGFLAGPGKAIEVASSGLIIIINIEGALLQSLAIAGQGMTIPKNTIATAVLPLLTLYSKAVIGSMPRLFAETGDLVGKANGVEWASHPTGSRAPLGLSLDPNAFILPVEPDEPERNSSGNTRSKSRTEATGAAKAVEALFSLIEFAKSAVDVILLNPFLPQGVRDKLNDIFPPTPGTPPDSGWEDNPSIEELPPDNGTQAPNWDIEKKSPWVRAAFPWVMDGRKPFREAALFASPFGNAGRWYRNWTNNYTLSRCAEFRRSSQVAMHVMKKANEDGRGSESWREAGGSREADNLFTVTVFVHRSAKTLAAPVIFGGPPPDAHVAYARAMFYHAGAARAGGALRQPILSWDTLSWASQPREFDDSTDNDDDEKCPGIKLNWEAKLVPVGSQSRLAAMRILVSDQVQSNLSEPLRREIKRIFIALPNSTDH